MFLNCPNIASYQESANQAFCLELCDFFRFRTKLVGFSYSLYHWTLALVVATFNLMLSQFSNYLDHINPSEQDCYWDCCRIFPVHFQSCFCSSLDKSLLMSAPIFLIWFVAVSLNKPAYLQPTTFPDSHYLGFVTTAHAFVRSATEQTVRIIFCIPIPLSGGRR